MENQKIKFDFVFLGQSILKYQVPLDIFYAINQILANQLTANKSISAPTPNDVIAVVTSVDNIIAPIRGRPDQIYERTYFGPVTLERFAIHLYDDKGNLLNLNGRDWSFTLRVEQLYQY